MNIQELMLFYTKQGNKEFDIVVAKDGELDTTDFAHQSFCLSCVTLLMERAMIANLASLDFAARLWSGKYLYELDQLRRKHREWN